MMVGFVIGHMAGNLKAFGGFDSAGIQALDLYAFHLRQIGEAIFGFGNFLWILRVGLILAVILHVASAISLTKRNLSSRSQGYAVKKYNSATVASLTMSIGGTLLLCFIIFHILHFTTGTLHHYGFKEGFVYANVYNAFQHTWVTALYVVAMIALGLHLYHGAWSVFQTLGIEAKGWNNAIRSGATLLAIVVAIGFISVPVAFYLDAMPVPTPVSVIEPGGH